jgi:hypothetical protein
MSIKIRPGSDRQLAPVRWSSRPRASTVVRTALVAALLALAAGLLYAPDHPAPCETTPTPPAAPPPSDPAPAAQAPSDRARLAVPDGAVGVPVRLAEPAALTVVRPGSRVDLVAVAAPGASAAREHAPVATEALVLGVVGADAAGPVDSPPVLYLALPRDQAVRTIAMPDGVRFGIIVCS